MARRKVQQYCLAVEGRGHCPLQRRLRRLARHHRWAPARMTPHALGAVVGGRWRNDERAGP
ncbi:hypothetical protein ACIBL8_38710 [Streptomyces sp. NPDC050523]|uniref:hypothetical protein n=1 Tax=Streptomyces sp. NPDC050523 TaxID=3365622 RepID=UPI0037B27D5B